MGLVELVSLVGFIGLVALVGLFSLVCMVGSNDSFGLMVSLISCM